MAEIHLLPLRLSTEGAAQIAAMLSGALAEGIDLGPRGPHIRALGLSLDALLTTLRAELARVFTPTSSGSPELEDIRAYLDCAFQNIETLVSRAREFPL